MVYKVYFFWDFFQLKRILAKPHKDLKGKYYHPLPHCFLFSFYESHLITLSLSPFPTSSSSFYPQPTYPSSVLHHFFPQYLLTRRIMALTMGSAGQGTSACLTLYRAQLRTVPPSPLSCSGLVMDGAPVFFALYGAWQG